MPLHHPRKSKSKLKENKRNIKSRKINKKKRKILVFKHTMTVSSSLGYTSRETCLPSLPFLSCLISLQLLQIFILKFSIIPFKQNLHHILL